MKHHRTIVKNAAVGNAETATRLRLSSSFIVSGIVEEYAGCWKRYFYAWVAFTISAPGPKGILNYAQNTSSLIGAKVTIIQAFVNLLKIRTLKMQVMGIRAYLSWAMKVNFTMISF